MIVSVIKIQRDPDTHRYNTILVRAQNFLGLWPETMLHLSSKVMLQRWLSK